MILLEDKDRFNYAQRKEKKSKGSQDGIIIKIPTFNFVPFAYLFKRNLGELFNSYPLKHHNRWITMLVLKSDHQGSNLFSIT